MVDVDLLCRLYKSYGFDISTVGDVCVFVYKKSRYFGVDIILLNSNDETKNEANRIKEDFSRIGFAVNVKEIETNNEAEDELFKSFFSYNSTKERLKRKYSEFVRKQTKSLLGNEYRYVECPFEFQNHDEIELPLFEILDRRFVSSNPELIIIEAAAGFGKTCTAYEILNRVASEDFAQLPIFTELSRNRVAKIFRYILLDEIDLEYPSLNSELVIKEIKNGRIPLIIDGFDELLEKVKTTESSVTDSFEEVESMLETIGSLLEHKTKIILTTRKTAIFTGLEFDTWLKKWGNKFNLTRVTLKEPRIKDWMGTDKFGLVKDQNIPIQYLANPVILTFLRDLEFSDFSVLMKSPELLVHQYFEKMLEREKERQSLPMTVENQLQIFKNVTKMLMELDSTAEEKDFFKEIIIEDNRKVLDYTRTLYGSAERPSMELLVDKLSTHALLDRKGREQSRIGFINDFVFGTFIGQVIVECDVTKLQNIYSAYMIDLAVTAYRVQSERDKHLLWEKIQFVLKKFESYVIFTFDIYLKNVLRRDYSSISINDLSFFNTDFTTHKIDSAVFVNCYFKNCTFKAENINAVSFIGSTFDNCRVADSEYLDSKNEITAIKCKQKKCAVLIEEGHYEDLRNEIVSDLEKELLRKLWNISNTKAHHIVQLIQQFGEHRRKDILKALKSLEAKGLIRVSGIYTQFEINKIPTIKEILDISHELQ